MRWATFYFLMALFVAGAISNRGASFWDAVGHGLMWPLGLAAVLADKWERGR